MRGKLNKITEEREKLIFDSFAKLCFGQKSILIGKVMKFSLWRENFPIKEEEEEERKWKNQFEYFALFGLNLIWLFDDELKSIRWRIFSRFDQYCFIEKENEKKMKIEIKKMKKKRKRGKNLITCMWLVIFIGFLIEEKRLKSMRPIVSRWMLSISWDESEKNENFLDGMKAFPDRIVVRLSLSRWWLLLRSLCSRL